MVQFWKTPFWPVYIFSLFVILVFCLNNFFRLCFLILSIKLIIYYFILNIFSSFIWFQIRKNWKKIIWKRRRENDERHTQSTQAQHTDTPSLTSLHRRERANIYEDAFTLLHLRYSLRNQLWFTFFMMATHFAVILWWENLKS